MGEYEVIRIRRVTHERLASYKKAEESWADFIERMCNTFEAALDVMCNTLKPRYAEFVEFKGLRLK